MSTLDITEVYASIQGESTWAGRPCTFVRLAGCPLRCRWCDTVYSFAKGTPMSISEVVAKVSDLGIALVELTGGEPLAQKSCRELLYRLDQLGFATMIETSGAYPISDLPSQTKIIMDIKCPDSGMSERNLWSNIDLLQEKDEVKFVVASRSDFDYAVMISREYNLAKRCTVLVSAAFGLVKEKEIVEWLLETKFLARLNMQIHKYIWSPRAKGV